MEKYKKSKNFNSDKIFFTSDTHFNHNNIIKFCNRPFSCVEEMNEKLISNWNNIVPEDGIVFHLGDFIFGGNQVFKDILYRLNGFIYLILGNRDLRQNINYKNFENKIITYEQLNINVNDINIYLNHYPFLCFTNWQLFGHLHLKKNYIGSDLKNISNISPKQYDVGVDLNNYFPLSWNEIYDIINNQIKTNTTVYDKILY